MLQVNPDRLGHKRDRTNDFVKSVIVAQFFCLRHLPEMEEEMRPALVRDREKAKVLSHRELAELLGVSYANLANQREQGLLPFRAIKIGQQYRYPREAVERWLRGDIEPVEK